MNVERLPTEAKKTFYKTVRAAFSENTSGLEPIGTKVLVLMDSIEDKTNAGLQLTPDTVEKITLAILTGVVVAVGGAAFSDWPNSTAKWPGNIPSAGTRVYVAKYSGQVVQGIDGKMYKFVHDTDLMGFETRDAKPQLFGVPAKSGVQ